MSRVVSNLNHVLQGLEGLLYRFLLLSEGEIFFKAVIEPEKKEKCQWS